MSSTLRYTLIISVLVLLIFALLSIVLRSCSRAATLRDERKDYFVDTLRYEGLAPERVAPNELGQDSLYTFRDTTEGRWCAEVEGSNVSLRSLVILDPQDVRREFVRPEWEVSLKSGVAAGSLWSGVGVSRNYGRLKLSLDGGYDAWQGTPYVGASVAYTLWQE